jgi:hypothetical protein
MGLEPANERLPQGGGILIFHDLELHHLTAGEVLHVALFMMLCEAFLGILPHFALWRHFFHVHAGDGPIPLIEEVTLELCLGRVRQYIQLLVVEAGAGVVVEVLWGRVVLAELETGPEDGQSDSSMWRGSSDEEGGDLAWLLQPRSGQWLGL